MTTAWSDRFHTGLGAQAPQRATPNSVLLYHVYNRTQGRREIYEGTGLLIYVSFTSATGIT